MPRCIKPDCENEAGKGSNLCWEHRFDGERWKEGGYTPSRIAYLEEQWHGYVEIATEYQKRIAELESRLVEETRLKCEYFAESQNAKREAYDACARILDTIADQTPRDDYTETMGKAFYDERKMALSEAAKAIREAKEKL